MSNIISTVFVALAILIAGSGFGNAQMPSLPATPPAATSTEDQAANPSLDDLIGILENEGTRNKLIESLKASAYVAPKNDAQGAQPEPDSPVMTLPGRLALYSKAVIGWFATTLDEVSQTARQSVTLLSGTGSLDLPRVADAISPVILVVAVVFAVLLGARLVKKPIFDRLSRQAARSGPVRKLFLLIVSSLIDAAGVFVGWAAGYLAAVLVWGGNLVISQALFLNAFLIIEAVKVGFGLVIAPRYPQLRLTPFGDRMATYWYFWLSRTVSFIGYGFLFVAPVVQQNSSLPAANAVRFIVAFVSFATAVVLILQNRKRVGKRLAARFRSGDHSLAARFNMLLGRIWWILALVFVFVVFSTWLSSPVDGLRYLTSATLKSLGAILVGGFILKLTAPVIANGVAVPQGVSDRLPLLERHINSFIPNALTVIRLVIVVVVVAYFFKAWELYDLTLWAQTSVGQRVIGGALGATVVLFLGFTIFVLISSWVEYRLNPNFGKVPTARERTLLALFRNGFTITLAVIVLMLVLSQIGIDIGPLLAGAGVVGLAVGFGAQKLVQDIITGAFIQLENAMNEGDVVQIGSVSGVVERLTIRSVALRSLDGTYTLIPFSSVDNVSNMTKDFSNFVCDFGVAYRENTDDVKQVMQDAFDILRENEQGSDIIGDFEMFGVNSLGDSSVTVRGRIRTLPGKQWGLGRLYNEILKKLCDERQIEIPFPQMTLWFGTGKDGTAPPLRTVEIGEDATRAEISRAASSPPMTVKAGQGPTLSASSTRLPSGEGDGHVPPDHDDLAESDLNSRS